MMKNWIIILSIVLIGAATLGGIYYFFGTTEQTTSVTDTTGSIVNVEEPAVDTGGAAANTPNFARCNEYWWIDPAHPTCQSPKQFCGSYMYQGLEVYDTEASCAAR